MRIEHNSRNIEHRRPFGAVVTGTRIRLAIDVYDCESSNTLNIKLNLWHEDDSEPEVIEMVRTNGDDSESAMSDNHEGRIRFETEITAPEEVGLLWYNFSIQSEVYGEMQYQTYEKKYREGRDRRFQITVYEQAAVPEWYRDGIVYQIFPDRFARDEAWESRCKESNAIFNDGRNGEKRFTEPDWDKKAYYVREEDNSVTDWPIYGGSFKGIESKLDYLKSLGVTVIYLNPIFESVSNHHYDTADYMNADPALGTNEDFVHLAKSAKERGIRIILDGVFSHTGSDSKYFDLYGNYEKQGFVGAYGHEDSPYRNWYKFDENETIGYKSWWGVKDLPEVDEDNPDFSEFITGNGGVIDYWTKLGASGWRLDVADELPDDFIRKIRKSLKNANSDGLLIGEVWEDASNKVSYGERRKYFMGEELDGTMNYPLRQILLDYVNYTISAGEAADELMTLQENYPRENFYGALNLIGSHDRERILTLMAEAEDHSSAVRKVRMLSTIQYTLPGVPSIYYGEEAGMVGGADPENRSGFPWGHEDGELEYHYRNLGLMYHEHPVLKDGDLMMLEGSRSLGDDIFAFIRSEANGEKILVLANRSYGPVQVNLRHIAEAKCGYALELLESEVMQVEADGYMSVFNMEPLSAKVILLLDEEPTKVDLGRKSGVICHISSLGVPKLGKPAREFADYLASAGMKIWQVLPINPTGIGGSPYSSYSAFAGNTDFINYEELPSKEGFKEFCQDNMDWLCEYAAFSFLREKNDFKPWNEWPEDERNANPADIISAQTGDAADKINKLVLEQYYFYAQWKDLKEYVNGLGIELMGDIPMYMSADSADVWANKEVFLLDEDGRQRVHAGVPPDAFSEDGQDWGNPLYDWEYLRKNGFGWWIRRLKQCAGRYDILRIDHFRGLSEYFAIPEGEKPLAGVWQRGGGLEFLRTALSSLEESGLKLFAEDLGYLDPGVKNLLKLSGLPGMDIWQFTSRQMLEMTADEAKVRAFYTGTHDNDTLLSFVKSYLKDELSAKAETGAENSGNQDTLVNPKTSGAGELSEESLEIEANIEALKIIRTIYESDASLAMIQLQDMFLLDGDARMNVPGVAEGNWTWKIPGDSIENSYHDAEERAAWFKELATRTGR